MKNIYEYIYYSLYTWNLKKWGESDNPKFNAVLGVSFLMFLNTLTLLFIFDLILHMQFFVREEMPLIIIIISSTFFLAINYFRFIPKQRFKAVVKKYKQESKKTRKRKLITIWTFTIISFIIPFLIAYGVGKKWW